MTEQRNENALHQMLGRIDAKVDILLSTQVSHDARITAVERKQWWTAGVAAGAVFLLTRLPDLKAFF